MRASSSWRAGDVDPLSAAAFGTALTGGASFVWPELVAGTVVLAALTSFVVWARAVRALRRRDSTGFRAGRLTPFVALGGAGWGLALWLEPLLPPVRALLLGTVAVGFRVLARSRWVGL
jgi:hypothetical protein